MGKVRDLSDLDGDYSITYQTEAPPLSFNWYDHTQATAKISNGILTGIDLGGVVWHAEFELLIEGKEVNFKARVDPTSSPPNTFVLDARGQPTRSHQEYKGRLKVATLGDKVILHGVVNHGVCNISVTLKRD